MRIIYVSGPYRAETLEGIRANIDYAGAVALRLWQMGYVCICPHKNTGWYPETDGDWIAGDLEIIKRLLLGVDSVVMLPGWEKSEGATTEKEYAENRGLKIWYWPKDKEKLKTNVSTL